MAVVVRQREVDRLNAVVVLLAFAHVAKAANAVVGLEVEFLLQRVHKHAKHVEQHALAACLNHAQHLHIDECGEHNGFCPVHDACMVDLAYRLVGLVGGVDKGQAHPVGFGLKLGQDGVAKGFGGDARAVGDKENAALGHGENCLITGLVDKAAPYAACALVSIVGQLDGSTFWTNFLSPLSRGLGVVSAAQGRVLQFEATASPASGARPPKATNTPVCHVPCLIATPTPTPSRARLR